MDYAPALSVFSGEDRGYSSKLTWQHLPWKGPAKAVKLRHHRDGPIVVVNCREFDATSQNETDLFWKDSKGWQCIKTTPFGLETYEKSLDEYISQYVIFYTQNAVGELGYLEQVLKTVVIHLEVSF